MPKKNTALENKIRELQLRALRSRQGELKRTGSVPSKKKSKPVGYKLQNTFDRSLQGVPGGKGLAGIINMVESPRTGTRVRKEEIGLLRSARNANTTQGNYVTTVVREGTRVVSDPQGRKEFGR